MTMAELRLKTILTVQDFDLLPQIKKKEYASKFFQIIL